MLKTYYNFEIFFNMTVFAY